MTSICTSHDRLPASALLALAALGFTSAEVLEAAEAVVRIADRELPAVAVGRQLAVLVEADWIDQDEAFRAEAGKLPAPPAAVANGVATWQDAMLLASLDWTVEKKPLRDEWGNELQDGFGKDANISGIFRDIDNALLGVVRDRYSTIQNKEAFAWVDALIGQEGAHYDSAGALK